MKYVTVVLISALLPLSGCGTARSGSGEGQVRSVVHEATTAIAQRDYRRACSLFTQRLRADGSEWPRTYRNKTCPERYRSNDA
jgi:uncharacterized protein YceK